MRYPAVSGTSMPGPGGRGRGASAGAAGVDEPDPGAAGSPPGAGLVGSITVMVPFDAGPVSRRRQRRRSNIKNASRGAWDATVGAGWAEPTPPDAALCPVQAPRFGRGTTSARPSVAALG